MLVIFLRSDTLIRIVNILREKGDLNIIYLCIGNNKGHTSFVCLFVCVFWWGEGPSEIGESTVEPEAIAVNGKRG